MKKTWLHPIFWQKTLLAFLLTFSPSVFSEPQLHIAIGHENYDFAQLFSRFKRQHNIDLITAQFDNTQMKIELLQRAEKQQLPDVIVVPGDYVGLKNIINLSAIPTNWLNNHLSQTSLAASSIDGTPYGIPIISGNHLLLYYNKSIIAQPAQSWQQLVAQQSSLNEGVSLIGWSYNEMFWFIPFLGAFDALPMTNGKVTLDTIGMQQALAFYQQQATQNVVDHRCNYQCTVARFEQQQLGYMINGAWAYTGLKKALGDNLGVAILPSINSQPMIPYYSVHLMAFPNQGALGPKQAALKQLAQYMQSEQVQRQIWSQFHGFPVEKNALHWASQTSDVNFKIMLQQLQQSQPMPNSPAMAIVWEAMLKGFNRYSSGIFDEQQASAFMQHLAERSIENM